MKYNVTWVCPHCENPHNWWWESEWEAHDDGITFLECDCCGAKSRFKGDGKGHYTHVPSEPQSDTRSLEQRVKDLEELEEELHKRCMAVENTGYGITKRLKQIETALMELSDTTKAVSELERIVDTLCRTVTRMELDMQNLRDGIVPPPKEKTEWDLTPKFDPHAGVKAQTSFIDLIHGAKPPFHARLREGCQFTKEELPPDKLASVLRFIAVEVERMTERDMGGSFTVSNLTVAQNLRDLAADASVEDYIYDPDHNDE